MNERAKEVRPLDSGPAISVIAPAGRPPSSKSSMEATPVGATGRMTFGAGVSAEGIRFARAFSIWSRIADADCMANLFRLMFALPARHVKGSVPLLWSSYPYNYMKTNSLLYFTNFLLLFVICGAVPVGGTKGLSGGESYMCVSGKKRWLYFPCCLVTCRTRFFRIPHVFSYTRSGAFGWVCVRN
jgi:hypothetical protein